MVKCPATFKLIYWHLVEMLGGLLKRQVCVSAGDICEGESWDMLGWPWQLSI